jgi:Capsule assembly protein Wzi
MSVRSGRVLFIVFAAWLISRAVCAQSAPGKDEQGTASLADNIAGTRIADSAGSTYIPLDSWIYPAVERLAALGYVRTQFLGLRPWTRVAVAEMLSDASEHSDYDPAPEAFVGSLMNRLQAEFAGELSLETLPNQAVRLESVYGRAGFISGTPLNDSYHFGQTLVNDFGRPYGEGCNAVAGFTTRGELGRYSIFVRGEYQHSAPAGILPAAVRNVLASIDNTAVLPLTTMPSGDRFRLLEAYLGVTFLGQQLSIGKQSLWWGPGQSGALILSDNAEPFYMVRLAREVPLHLPGILRWLGPVRYDNFFGKLAGHQFPPDPFMYGQKISLKPTPNLEVGFSRTTVFAGKGVSPLTFGSFFHSFFSVTSGNGLAGNLRQNPGARHAGFDFSYRLPGLRRWLTIYSDFLVHDDVSPVSAPRRSAINPGIYLSHVPGVPRLDFRAEAVSTDPPTDRSVKGAFLYWEVIYRDLYLNKGKLLGSWIGREGKGGQAWLTYWLSPSSTIQVSYRTAKVAKDFIPGGVTQNDFSVNTKLRLRRDLELQSSLQYELWNAPLLANGLRSVFATSFQVTYWPKRIMKKAAR